MDQSKWLIVPKEKKRKKTKKEKILLDAHPPKLINRTKLLGMVFAAHFNKKFDKFNIILFIE
jgi:hypothetical protein